MTSTFEAAIFKIFHGDTRTGHCVLRSHGLHPPCPETSRLMQSKFITDPAKDSIAQELDLRNHARRCRAPKVQPKLIAKVIGNTNDCKASGISAWRSSRLKNIATTDAGLGALTRWTQAWVDGVVPDLMADP